MRWTSEDILNHFEMLANEIQKEGRAFGDQAGIPEGSKPGEIHKDSAASYQCAAKMVRDRVNTLRKLLQN